MDLEITGRVFVVAGSSRGIGKAIAGALLDEGAQVCITGRDGTVLRETERAFADGERVLAFEGDLSQPEVISSMFAAVQAKWERVDGLVANLGTGVGKAGWDQSEDEWERLFRFNFQAGTRLAQSVLPLMLDRGGSIVFIASITGVEATGAPLPYSAAKAALLSYSKNLARSVAGRNVRVNCVAPGNIMFAGGSWERRLAEQPEAVMQAIKAEVPMQRFGTPREIADLVAFLCSKRASFITGSCFVADGGQTRSL